MNFTEAFIGTGGKRHSLFAHFLSKKTKTKNPHKKLRGHSCHLHPPPAFHPCMSVHTDTESDSQRESTIISYPLVQRLKHPDIKQA